MVGQRPQMHLRSSWGHKPEWLLLRGSASEALIPCLALKPDFLLLSLQTLCFEVTLPSPLCLSWCLDAPDLPEAIPKAQLKGCLLHKTPLQTFPAGECLSTPPPPVVAATMQVLKVSSCIIAIHGSLFLPNGKLPETRPHVSWIVGLPGAWHRGWAPSGFCNYSLDWIQVGEQLGNLQATWKQKPASRRSTTQVLTVVRVRFRG